MNLPRLYLEDGFYSFALCDALGWIICEELARSEGWCKLIAEGINVTMEKLNTHA